MPSSPIRWLGGKSLLVRRILPLFPAHRLYCEPFGGGASLLLAKKRSNVEVYNDADGRLATLFRVLRDPITFGDFLTTVMMVPFSREERHRARTESTSTDDMEAAIRTFILSRQSFGGLIDKTAWGLVTGTSTGGMAQSTSQWIKTIERLPAVHRRLRDVDIRHGDWRTMVDELDGPDSLFYLDPPYVPETRRDGWYEHDMTMEEHQGLVERLLRLEGAAVLSGYPNAVYEPLKAAGWTRRDFDVACMVVARTKATGLKGTGAIDGTQRRTECCWISPRTTKGSRR